MVLSNKRSTVRVVESFNNVHNGDKSPLYPHINQDAPCFPILQMRHPNFVDIDKIYLFQGGIFAIT